MRVEVSLTKVHEWIEHMAIKVLSKDKFWTLVWLVEVYVLLSVSLQGILAQCYKQPAISMEF